LLVTTVLSRLLKWGLSPGTRPVYDKNDQAAIFDLSLVNARVPPADLEEYRRCHKFVAPCCLCAFIDNVAMTESRIGVVGEASGENVGQYMAECARKRCGYSGEASSLHALTGLLTKNPHISMP
jgi:hypothetical protein